MRAVVQRVKSSSVKVDSKIIGSIGFGLNVLLGVAKDDTIDDVEYLKNKILNLRIFEDDNGKLSKSIIDVKGELIVISQFTLYGDCRKGRRPNFMQACSGDMACKLYNEFVNQCKDILGKVATGKFGANMLVSLENDGPVTLIIESRRT